jgi:hypothetical protein
MATMPAIAALCRQKRSLVRPVALVDAGLLHDDHAAPTRGAAAVVRELAVRDPPLVVAEVRDVGTEQDAVARRAATEIEWREEQHDPT